MSPRQKKIASRMMQSAATVKPRKLLSELERNWLRSLRWEFDRYRREAEYLRRSR